MTIYVQYNPEQADANQHVIFGVLTGPEAPQPPAPWMQLILPDDTDLTNKIVDLSQNPPALIPIT